MQQLLDSPKRLASIAALGLAQHINDPALDAVTRLAADLIDSPVALVSIVTDDRQVFDSQIGLTGYWQQQAQTPLSHSFCRHVVQGDKPLVIDDARQHDLVRDNLAIRDLGAIAYNGVPLHAPDGETIGALCVIDVAARQWTQKESRQLRDLGDLVEQVLVARLASTVLLTELEGHRNLVASLVHDIRQPLTTASGVAQLLGDFDDLGEEPTELVSMLDESVGRAGRLLEELLERPLEPVGSVDLGDVAEGIRRASSLDHRRRLRVDVPTGTDVQGDRPTVERIVSNLVRNAMLHAGPDAKVQVRGWRGFDGVVLEVEDDGVGIDASDLERIFEMGEQGRGHGPGSGMGLHIVRALAGHCGGDVTVDSHLGRGTTFRVHLRDVVDLN